ncbi:MAG: hypothetical protein JWL68_317, partial [Actinomycetia bacterium]|nr:hypothetical protein [Actinomycetes bacterium]
AAPGAPGGTDAAFLRRPIAAPVARCGPVMPGTHVVTLPGALSAAPDRNGR